MAAGAPCRPPSAYKVDRSRVITSTPGCSSSHFCKAVRGPHRNQIDHIQLLQVHEHCPVALLLTPSLIINAQHSHRRLAYAATSLLARRNTVSSLLLIPSRFRIRSPGRPPRAYPTKPSISHNRVVSRAFGAATAGSCSAKIFRRHSLDRKSTRLNSSHLGIS